MQNNIKATNFSFWESQTFFKNIDLVVVGSGIVGLSTAISFKQKNKKAKVLVLEKGILPQGASTKNAGFACFGSVSELISDIKATNNELVWQTVEMRVKGLELLRKRLMDKNIDYKPYGGYELFDSKLIFEECVESIPLFNKNMKEIIGDNEVYKINNKAINTFNFKKATGVILNRKEGQIDTGMMMKNLITLAISNGIIVFNCIEVSNIIDNSNSVLLQTSIGDILSKQVVVATNGFANELLKIKDVKPARAQVLITKPISGLKIKGSFHFEEGYYYFRNINNRILLGGGRHLALEKETTTNFELNDEIQSHLIYLLKSMILPKQKFEIEQRWCGIMGVGSEKKPIVKKISKNVLCAVRMGGMGVAIGSLVGKMAIDELER